VLVLPGSGKSRDQFRAEDARCRQRAASELQTTDHGTVTAQGRYDTVYMQCMYAEGNQIPCRGAVGVRRRMTHLRRRAHQDCRRHPRRSTSTAARAWEIASLESLKRRGQSQRAVSRRFHRSSASVQPGTFTFSHDRVTPPRYGLASS
jgi:hypothetical protein